MDGVIFLDLETTGLAETDEIIEIGAVKLSGGETATYQQLVNPSLTHISPRIFKLCGGITHEQLRKSPRFAEIKEELLKFIGDMPLLCHNAAFEKRMLEKALGEKLNNEILDTLELFVIFKPQFHRHGMDYLMEHYLKESRPAAHRALADAQDTMKLLHRLFADLAQADAPLLNQTIAILGQTKWQWLPYLKEIAPVPLQQASDAAFEDEQAPECDITPDDMANLLENEKAWQEHFPGYRVRPQQIEMSLAVSEAFMNDQALFVEAPTGSGKTLAYLLVALRWAAREKERVYISTNTKNLQQQIMDELPRLARMLEIANMLFAEMKGIGNYICRRRAEEESTIPGNGLETQLARAFLSNWTRRSSSGEDEEITYWFKQNNPYLNRVLNSLRCSREDCAGPECGFYRECFYHRKVRAMQRSHLCTVNHSLLLTWPGNYPQIKRVIIDEAHALEEKAFEAFTRELSSFDLTQFLDRLVQGESRGYLHYLRIFTRKVLPKIDFGPALDTLERMRFYAGDISILLENLQNEKSGGYKLRCEIPRDYKELHEAVKSLSMTLSALARFLEETLKEIDARDAGFGSSALFRQGEEHIKTCHAWAGLLEDTFNDETEENCCRYLECSGSYWSFRIAPLDVAAQFHSKVIAGSDTLILTSATLAEKGEYARHAQSLGFDRLEEDRLIFKDPLPHVYDYAKCSVLAIPGDSPGYNSPQFVDYAAGAVTGLARLLGGRTLVLFSSLERMQKVMEAVRLPLEMEGISVLGGRNSSRRSDLELFKEDANTVLFGSRGYFEGVDIKGLALSGIIIEKLSFASPEDPLQKSRSNYIEKVGLNPFVELSLPEAIKTLRQQFGRLIRSDTDRGVVLILDQLGDRKWYGELILKELPGPRLIKGIKLNEIITEISKIFSRWAGAHK